QTRRRASTGRRPGQKKQGELQCARRSLQVGGGRSVSNKGAECRDCVAAPVRSRSGSGTLPNRETFFKLAEPEPQQQSVWRKGVVFKDESEQQSSGDSLSPGSDKHAGKRFRSGSVLSPDESSPWRPKSRDCHST